MSVIIRNLDATTEVLDEKYDQETLTQDITRYVKFEHEQAKSQLINHIQIDNPGSSSMSEIVLERIKELQHFYKSIDEKIDQLLKELRAHLDRFRIELSEVVKITMLKAFMIHCIKHAETINPLWFSHYDSYFIKECDTIIYVSPRYRFVLYYYIQSKELRTVGIDVKTFEVHRHSFNIFVLRQNLTVYNDAGEYMTHIPLQINYEHITIDEYGDNEICVYNYDYVPWNNHQYCSRIAPCSGELYDSHGRFVKKIKFSEPLW
jgi:hypothetical protein